MDCFKLKGFNKILTNYMPQKLEFDFRKGNCITFLNRNFYFRKKTLQGLEWNLIHWTLLFNNLNNSLQIYSHVTLGFCEYHNSTKMTL